MSTVRNILFVLGLALGCASAQTNIQDINTFKSSTSQPNCTSIHQPMPDPSWENNCDGGTPNCNSNSGIICTSMTNNLVTSPSLDNKAREFDISWTCPGGGSSCNGTTGGAIFHSGINTGGDTQDTSFTWGGHFFYTDVSNINQFEFDLNQVLTGSDVMIYAAQCDINLNGGFWEFANGWGLHSNIPCPKSQWTSNTWHEVKISAHRCTNFVSGQACNITYDSVAFDGIVINCTKNCVADGRDGLSWSPIGLLLLNVQLNPGFSTPGNTKVYADEVSVVSPETTSQQVPLLKCDSITGALTIKGKMVVITSPVGTNCTLK